ncbi:hypothetical protein GCM10025770_32500 [Viridibacterium curvum]|uniref:Uncharacterized protein n=1 Tax=Viridibacterium curvum TaxID=1101404 RepID=A0ABP9R0I9_9RHOO
MQQDAAVVPGLSNAGLKGNGAAAVLQSFLTAPQGHQDGRATDKHVGIVRGQYQRLATGRQCFLQPAEAAQNGSAIP